MQNNVIKKLKSFEEVIPYLEGKLKENEVIEVNLVETRLHHKQGRKYRTELLDTVEKAAKLGQKLLPRNLDRENIFVVGCTAKMEPIAIHLVSIGSISASILEPARVLTFLLLSGSHSFLLFHNHPSGDTHPSDEDVLSTKRIKEAANLTGLKLIDHLIIGKDYTSMKEQGYL